MALVHLIANVHLVQFVPAICVRLCLLQDANKTLIVLILMSVQMVHAPSSLAHPIQIVSHVILALWNNVIQRMVSVYSFHPALALKASSVTLILATLAIV